MSLKGVPVTLLDTAGMREKPDVVERIGIERAEATARGSDVVVMVMDVKEGWTESDSVVFDGLWGNGNKIFPPGILVANKTDLTGCLIFLSCCRMSSDAKRAPSVPIRVSETFRSVILTSAVTKKGFEDLTDAILETVQDASVLESGIAWAINDRQSEALFRCHESLERVSESIHGALPIDLWTIDLRDAVLALGEIRGEELKEEVLDNVFRRFCIGK